MKKKRKLFCFLLSLSLIFTMTFGSVSVSAAPKLNKTKVTLLKGEKTTLKVTGTKQKVTWSSSKKSVATVNSKGQVVAKNKGSATILAKVSKKTYKCVVKVETPKLSKTSLTLTEKKFYAIKLTGTTVKVKYSSSNPKIARVDSRGKITAVKKGNAVITAKANTKKFTCKVTVKAAQKPKPKPTPTPVPKPSLNVTTLNMNKGDVKQLQVKNYKEILVWTSDDPSVATVDSKGKVTAVNLGTTKIQVRDKSTWRGSCTVCVTQTVKKQEEPVLTKGTKSAKKEITNDKGQKEVINVTINTYTYTFTTIPTNAEELKQYDITTPDGRYKTMALLILAYRTWTPTNPTDCEEMLSYLNNKEMTQYYKNFLRDRMKADNGYKYLGNSYLNGATPANNYTPSKPISITLRQDTLPGKGNSISEDIPYFEPTQTTPAIYRSFTDFAGSDSSRWICTYKHSKTGKWYIWDQSWHDLLTRIKQPAGNYEY